MVARSYLQGFRPNTTLRKPRFSGHREAVPGIMTGRRSLRAVPFLPDSLTGESSGLILRRLQVRFLLGSQNARIPQVWYVTSGDFSFYRSGKR